MTSNGIAYLCFGEVFDKTLAHLCEYSRRYTDLPFAIMTNVKERDSKWNDVSNVEFVYFDMETKDNREVKTQLHKHTPFDKTLYIDSDAVIQKEGIEKCFDAINDDAFFVNPVFAIEENGQTFNIYKRTIDKTNTKLPLLVVSGGFFGFSKSHPDIKNLFDDWNHNWNLMGRGREMPSLACALKKNNFKYTAMKNAFEPDCENPDVIVQHDWSWSGRGLTSPSLYDKLNIPKPEQDKSFDTNVSDDWRVVPCTTSSH